MTEPRDALEIEQNTLRLLCAECLEAEQRNAFSRKLQPSLFLDPIHRVLFEEIRELHTADVHRLRELLAARVTNRGFPDANLEMFLSEGPLSAEILDSWVRSAEALTTRQI